MIWPETICASSLASQATAGDAFDGSIGSNTSGSNSSGSFGAPAPMVEEMRVRPPGEMTLAVTPMPASSSEMVRVRPAMADLAAA